MKTAHILLVAALLINQPIKVAAQGFGLVQEFFFDSQVFSIFVYGDNLFVGGLDNYIRQYKLSDRNFQFDYIGNGTVYSIVASDTKLYYGSFGAMAVFVFDIGNQQYTSSFFFSSEVWAIAVSGDYLFSIHGNGEIVQTELSTGIPVQTITHKYVVDAYYGMVVYGDYIFSAVSNFNVKQWRISDGGEVWTFAPRRIFLDYAIFIQEDFLFCADVDNHALYQISLNAGPGDMINTFVGHSDFINSIVASGDYLFSAANNGEIKQWRIRTGELVRDIDEHVPSPVWSLAIKGEHLLSGAEDRIVKQWFIPELSNSIGSPTSPNVDNKGNPGNQKINYFLVIGGAACALLLLAVAMVALKLKRRKASQQNSPTAAESLNNLTSSNCAIQLNKIPTNSAKSQDNGISDGCLCSTRDSETVPFQ